MIIQVTQESGATVVAVDGSIDSSKAKMLEQRINEILTQSPVSMLIDFAGLNYVSSAGLRVLLDTARRTKNVGGRFAVCGMNANVQDVFNTTHLHDILRLFNNRADALSAGLL